MNLALPDQLAVPLLRFWDWWSTELLHVLPLRLREATRTRQKLDIFISPNTVTIDHINRGDGLRLEEDSALDQLEETSWLQIDEFAQGQQPRLFLHDEDVYQTVLTLPRKAGEFVQETVRLLLQLHSPLSLDAINWGVHILSSTRSEVTVMLVIARLQTLDGIDMLFANRGIMPPVIGYMLDGEPIILRKPLNLESGLFGNNVSRFYLLSALLLFSIPLTTILGADLQASANRSRLAQLQSELEPKLKDNRSAQGAEISRRRAAPITGIAPAITVLEELARVIPKIQWITKATSGADGQINLILDAPETAEPDILLVASSLVRSASISDKQPSEPGRALYSIELSLK